MRKSTPVARQQGGLWKRDCSTVQEDGQTNLQQVKKIELNKAKKVGFHDVKSAAFHYDNIKYNKQTNSTLKFIISPRFMESVGAGVRAPRWLGVF